MSIHRLHGLYRHATEGERQQGRAWYSIAREDTRNIAGRVGRDARSVAGVIAALSPNTRWGRCLLDSERLCLGHGRREPVEDITVTTYHDGRWKAWRILDGEEPSTVLRGPKVTAFYRNLSGDWSVPCIDSHAINAWHGERVVGSDLWLRNEVTTLRRVTADYTRAAETHRMTPAEFQAIIWVTWKRRIKQGKAPGYKEISH